MTKKLIFLLIGIVFGAIFTFVILKKIEPKQEQNIQGLLTNILIPENQISVTTDNKYKAYLSVQDLSMFNSEIWIQNLEDNTFKRIDFGSDYRFISSPRWNPDNSKLAYVRIYPFELWISDVEGNKNLIYSQEDNKDSNLLEPAIGHMGKVNINWINSEEIEFENTSQIPSKYYAININSKLIRPTKDYVSDQKPLKNINFTHFSQRDKKWGGINLGHCKDETIHSAGCAVTSISMMLDYFDIESDPQKLDLKLSEAAAWGYIEGCEVRWNLIPNIANGIELKGAFFGKTDYKRLDYEINQGNPVIVGFNRVNFTDIPHWVLVTEKKGDEYIIKDPWDTKNKVKYLSEYGNFDHLIVYRKTQ